jgi:hypothetical protein
MRDAMAPFSDPKKWKTFSTKPGMLGIPCVFSPDLAAIAQAYSELQDARHSADYDVVDTKSTVGLLWATNCLDKTKQAFNAWSQVESTDEARLFLATLIFGVEWANRD